MIDKYHAVYERDEGVWIVEIAEEPRCHSWGRTLSHARKNIRDALSLWLDSDVDDDDIDDSFRFPIVVRELLADLDFRRTALRDAEFHLYWTIARSVNALVNELGLSLRDTAYILGMSHQRVHQLLKEMGETKSAFDLIDTLDHSPTSRTGRRD